MYFFSLPLLIPFSFVLSTILLPFHISLHPSVPHHWLPSRPPFPASLPLFILPSYHAYHFLSHFSFVLILPCLHLNILQGQLNSIITFAVSCCVEEADVSLLESPVFVAGAREGTVSCLSFPPRAYQETHVDFLHRDLECVKVFG